MTLYELRIGLLWVLSLLLGGVVSSALAAPLVACLSLPDWLSGGIAAVATLAGAVTLAGAAFALLDEHSMPLRGFAAVIAPVWLLIIIGVAVAVGFHFLLLPWRLNADWHQILVMFSGVGVPGALIHGLIYITEVRWRARSGQ